MLIICLRPLRYVLPIDLLGLQGLKIFRLLLLYHVPGAFYTKFQVEGNSALIFYNCFLKFLKKCLENLRIFLLIPV